MMSEEAKRASGQRPKKRKFTGNIYTRVNSSVSKANKDIPISASSKKLNNSCFEDLNADEAFSGYRIVDIGMFISAITKFLNCKKCGSDIEISETYTNGLYSKYTIQCLSCNEVSTFGSCSMNTEKINVPEINSRFIYGMRCIGNGLAGILTFCSVMDLPAPAQKTTYTKITREISSGVKKAANISMKVAAENERKAVGDDITVSGDGSWKTRGHASRIGIAHVIGSETRKVLDIAVMSSYCRGCNLWTNTKSGHAYEEWKKKHDLTCVKNHSGSAGKMEVDGMLKIFERSEERHNIRYMNYIGDGDTKTFKELLAKNVYGPDKEIKKIECIAHVKKRLGTRLRNLRKNHQGKKLEDGKSLCGRGRLTDKLINQLTTYYGNAIRNNKHNLMEMRKAVWAVFYHKRSSDAEPLHDFCPQGSDSWCGFQKAKAMGKEKEFSHKNIVPAAVMDSMKFIFKDLSDPSLLRRCLGGKTQNANESFNSLVWKFCPKTSGASRIIADIAANEAVNIFNEGRKGRLHIMKILGFKIGEIAIDAASKFDEQRLKAAEIQLNDMSLEKRRAKRMIKIAKLRLLKKKEGSVYKAGNF